MLVTVCDRGIICTPEAGPGHVCMFMTVCGIVFPPKGSWQHFLPQQEHQRHQAVANALCRALGGAGALRPSPPQGLGLGIVCAPTRPKTARVCLCVHAWRERRHWHQVRAVTVRHGQQHQCQLQSAWPLAKHASVCVCL